jgi:hypothetical protein
MPTVVLGIGAESKILPMTKPAFLKVLAWDLHLRGVPSVRSKLKAFVDNIWPLAKNDPNPGRWTQRFLRGRLSAARVTAMALRNKDREGPSRRAPGEPETLYVPAPNYLPHLVNG